MYNPITFVAYGVLYIDMSPYICMRVCVCGGARTFLPRISSRSRGIWCCSWCCSTEYEVLMLVTAVLNPTNWHIYWHNNTITAKKSRSSSRVTLSWKWQLFAFGSFVPSVWTTHEWCDSVGTRCQLDVATNFGLYLCLAFALSAALNHPIHSTIHPSIHLSKNVAYLPFGHASI